MKIRGFTHDAGIHPLLLCGGSETRLWPLSRKSYPKQFAKPAGEESLFQASARRLSGEGFASPMVITGSDFRFIVTKQLAAAEIAPAATLIEPEGRNTAPAILAAALVLEARVPGALDGARDAVAQAEQDLGFTRLAAEPWGQLDDISIDYAAMEKADNLSVVPYWGTGRIRVAGMRSGARQARM